MKVSNVSVCAVLAVVMLCAAQTSGSTLSRNNRVIALRNVPQKRQAHAFCNVRGKLAVIGGRGRRNSFFWNGSSGQWENFGALPNNLTNIHHIQCVGYNNGLILAGGFMDEFPLERPVRDIIFWNLKTAKIMSLGKIPANRARGSAAIVIRRGDLYIFGGTTIGHGRGVQTTKRWTDAFNPRNGRWRTLANSRRPRDHAGAVYHPATDSAYLAGGRLGGAEHYYRPRFAYKTVEVYNFRRNRWTDLRSNSLAFHPGSTPTICGSLLVLAGGEVDQATDDSRVDQTEVFNIVQNQWKLREGGRSVIAKFADRHGSPLVQCQKQVYRVAGASRDKFAFGAERNVERSQFQALLLDGVNRRCVPSTFWRTVPRRSPRLVTARRFVMAGESPPPIETSMPMSGTPVPEVPGMGEEGETKEPLVSAAPTPYESPSIATPTTVPSST